MVMGRETTVTIGRVTGQLCSDTICWRRPAFAVRGQICHHRYHVCTWLRWRKFLFGGVTAQKRKQELIVWVHFARRKYFSPHIDLLHPCLGTCRHMCVHYRLSSQDRMQLRLIHIHSEARKCQLIWSLPLSTIFRVFGEFLT